MRVIVDPSFRSMDEIFDPRTRSELNDRFDVVWGTDDPMPTATFRRELAAAEAVVFGSWRHGALDADRDAPKLTALLEVAGGHHHNDLHDRSLLDRPIWIGSCAPAFVAPVAEMGIALTLASLRGVVSADGSMRAGSERWLHDGNRSNRSLIGATVGFVGCGGIATRLRAMLQPFDVSALGFDPPFTSDQLSARGFVPSDLTAIAAHADVIFALAAPTPATVGLLDRFFLESLNPRQLVVVLSRAAVVDFDTLTELVVAGRLRAAIDVYPDEPLAANDPLRTADDAVLTPHIAGALPGALHDIGRSVVHDLTAIAAGEHPDALQYLDPRNYNGLVQHQPVAGQSRNTPAPAAGHDNKGK